MISDGPALAAAVTWGLISAALLVRSIAAGRILRRRAERAERRFALLQSMAPALTSAATESAPAACGCILDRVSVLVGAQTLLCFIVVDGRLVLGAKSGAGYVGFLHAGDCYEGDTIVDWTRDHAIAAVVGPGSANLPSSKVVDFSKAQDGSYAIGPLVGSRDRVWACAIPLLRDRGYGLRPAVLGVIYLERSKDEPFSEDDASMLASIATLAADALQRALFADSVHRDSTRDQLTGLLTASAFRQRLRDEIEQRRYAPDGSRRDVALFFIDTDRFKNWNDSHGHAAGDRLLRQLADVFSAAAQSGGGFAGRNGGDEFCIALLDRTKDAAVAMAENLRVKVESADFGSLLAEPAELRGLITISVGVAHFPVDVALDDRQPSDSLLEAADAQMYEAKRAGRNRTAYARGHAAARKILHPGEGPIPRV